MKPLGVAVVGLGVGEAHARAFAGLPRCRLAALCDLDLGKAARLASALGDGGGRPRALAAPDYRELVRDAAVDVVSIASYDDAHFGQAQAALEAGKHVFVEKPLCRSLGEAKALLRAWRKGGRPHAASNLVLRGAPLYRWLREAVAAGKLGEIYAVDGDYLYGRLHKITDGWRRDVEGYSVMQGGGVHLVDLMMWVTGQRPVAVAAAGNRLASEGTAFRYPDYVAATFSFKSGMVGRVTANFGCVHRHQHRLSVFGTKATFLYDDRGARLHASRDPAVPARRLALAALPPGKGELIAGFVEGILKGRDPEAPFRHELDVISACVAADKALGAGKVGVEYL